VVLDVPDSANSRALTAASDSSNSKRRQWGRACGIVVVLVLHCSKAPDTQRRLCSSPCAPPSCALDEAPRMWSTSHSELPPREPVKSSV
jgi:hypothetical protein